MNMRTKPRPSRSQSGWRPGNEVETEQEIMGVALDQPHRRGISSHPADAWMLTALGRFCTANWRDRDTQWSHWRYGDRYAQLIDADRIARGWPPRQCAAASPLGEPSTLQEAIDRRQRAANAILEANEEMMIVSRDAAGTIYRLAWEDMGISEKLYRIAFNALYRLRVHFERVDKPKSR
jgi:hypothetical protein